MKTSRTRFIFLLISEVAVCVSLIAAIVYKNHNARAINVPIYDWQSDYISYEDGWYVDEDILPTRNSIDMIYGPYCELARGTYTIHIDYTASDDQACQIFATQGNNTYLRTGRSTLSKNQTILSYRFALTEDIDNFEVVIKYNGQGFLFIRDITITPDTVGLQRWLTVILLLFFALDLCLLFRRRVTKNRNLILALCGITLLVSLPLFMRGIAVGHDLSFHLMRMEGIAAELRRGIFPVRLSSLWMDGYGYPVSIYYGDLLLYVPALLRLAGFPVVTAYKAYIFFINLGTTAISYLCFQKMFTKRNIALLLTLAYTTAGYHFVCLYVRAAVGEYSAMMFLPILGLAIYQIYTKNPDNWNAYRWNALLLSIALTGLIGTHILSVEMAVFLLPVLCITLWKHTFRGNTLRVYGLAAFETALLNLYFIIPFLDFYRNVEVDINHTVDETVSKIQDSGAYISQYFSFFQTIFGQDATDVSARLAMTPGPVLMAALILAIVLWANQKTSRRLKYLTFFSCGVLFLASNLFPWNHLSANYELGQLLSQIQFPWRYLSIAILILTMTFGCVLQLFDNAKATAMFHKIYLSATIICFIMTCFFVSDYSNQATMRYYYETPELNLFAVSGGEYLRQGTNLDTLSGEVSGRQMQEVTLISRDGCHMELFCVVSEDIGYVEVPLLNYKGYQVTDEYGNSYAILDGRNNVIRFALPAGFSGKITIDFVEPWYWRVGEVVSALMLVGICGIGVWGWVRNKD